MTDITREHTHIYSDEPHLFRSKHYIHQACSVHTYYDVGCSKRLHMRTDEYYTTPPPGNTTAYRLTHMNIELAVKVRIIEALASI